MATGFGFPIDIGPDGAPVGTDPDAALRARIISVLFTAPGERVNQPDFGCGLLTHVFDPNNQILAAALEFTAGQALSRWLRDEIVVGAVRVATGDDTVSIDIDYLRRSDRARQALHVQFR